MSRRNRISCAFKSTAGFSRVGWSRGLKAAIRDRREVERLVERRRHPSDRRARFIHLTTLGEEAMAAVMRARDRVLSSRLSPLSGDELSTPGALSESTFSERALPTTAASKVSVACAATANAISVRSKMMAASFEPPLQRERARNITIWLRKP